MIEKEQTNRAKEFLHICPICDKEHTEEIFKDGVWHCQLCGDFHFSYEYRTEIDDLLREPEHGRIFIDFIQEQWGKTHKDMDINPWIIRRVLKEKGALK